MSGNRKGIRKMANGRNSYGPEGSGALTTNTTIQLSFAIVILAAVFSGAWWSSSMSAKVDAITASSSKLENDMNKQSSDILNSLENMNPLTIE